MPNKEKLTPAECGRIGGVRRWGPRRRVNLGDLTPAQRRLVLALIAAAREEPAREENAA